MSEETIEFTGTIVHITDEATLIMVDEVEDELWFPTSLIETDYLMEVGEEIEFSIPEWLAIKKDLI